MILVDMDIFYSYNGGLSERNSLRIGNYFAEYAGYEKNTKVIRKGNLIEELNLFDIFVTVFKCKDIGYTSESFNVLFII